MGCLLFWPVSSRARGLGPGARLCGAGGSAPSCRAGRGRGVAASSRGCLEAGWGQTPARAGRSFLLAVSDPCCVLQAPETLPELEDLKVKLFTQGF